MVERKEIEEERSITKSNKTRTVEAAAAKKAKGKSTPLEEKKPSSAEGDHPTPFL